MSALAPLLELSSYALVDQLHEQLRRERAQHRYNLAEKEREQAVVLRELAEVRLERARFEAFVHAPSPRTSLHY